MEMPTNKYLFRLGVLLFLSLLFVLSLTLYAQDKKRSSEDYIWGSESYRQVTEIAFLTFDIVLVGLLISSVLLMGFFKENIEPKK